MRRHKVPITITKNAWNKMGHILDNNNHNHYSFLFSAKSGGCNGFNYKLEMIDKNKFDDMLKNPLTPIYLNKDKTNLLIDPSSELLLLGTTIDYIEEDYIKNIFENKFIFSQPKEVATSCGCGHSFNPKESN